jgi:hypothetical protein
MVIFSKKVPDNVLLQATGPEGAIYIATDNGYVNEEVYEEWLEKIFIPNSGATKIQPVVLIQDNHSSHMGYKIKLLSSQNNVQLYNIPPHTSHIFQPLDQIFATLKFHYYKTAKEASLIREGVVRSKDKFPVLLKFAMAKIASNSYSSCFATSIYPFNKNAICLEKLTGDKATHTGINTTEENMPLIMECEEIGNRFNSIGIQTDEIQVICQSCDKNILSHPLVQSGRIPQYLATDLWIPQCSKQSNKKRRDVTDGHINSPEILQKQAEQIKEKEDAQKEKDEKRERKRKQKEERLRIKEEKQMEILRKKKEKIELREKIKEEKLIAKAIRASLKE